MKEGPKPFLQERITQLEHTNCQLTKQKMTTRPQDL
jgi:hypothetical protein